ncbi:MAG: SPFH domain-containing protein [Bacteroidales bacterium]|jgi:regulator of protease activity HflC (stomatin/prohibitin superfamily)|nr:SPFH domain-containing protein [Bacteroidales bacterium]
MKNEKVFSAAPGFLMLFLEIIMLGIGIAGLIYLHNLWFLALLIIGIFMLIGLVIVNPNESMVLVLFGAYKGTIKENGFFWINPFYTRRKISLRARNFDSEPSKVNDKVGNPIKIGVVLVWKVENTYKAAFEVNEYEHFVVVQSEAALRKLAGKYPYDNFEVEEAEITLRSGVEEVNHELEKEIVERLEIAGIHVIEARINYIAYAEEIASAMLRRQQATAIVAARHKIVEGAVGMVEIALEQLAGKNIIELDQEAKAAMVSNLMVVLCSDESARPVVNTGTLNH